MKLNCPAKKRPRRCGPRPEAEMTEMPVIETGWPSEIAAMCSSKEGKLYSEAAGELDAREYRCALCCCRMALLYLLHASLNTKMEVPHSTVESMLYQWPRENDEEEDLSPRKPVARRLNVV